MKESYPTEIDRSAICCDYAMLIALNNRASGSSVKAVAVTAMLEGHSKMVDGYVTKLGE